MSVTILETLKNAQINFNTGINFTISIAKEQLNNAIILLKKGYNKDDEVESLLEKYGNVNDVPEKLKE